MKRVTEVMKYNWWKSIIVFVVGSLLSAYIGVGIFHSGEVSAAIAVVYLASVLVLKDRSDKN